MDVTLPNGKVITGVPDGTSKYVVAQKAISAGLATNEDFGFSSGIDDKDLEGGFREGIGAGLTNVARRATNLVLPDSLTPEFASDEAIDEQTEIDSHLMGSGQAGKVVGEVAATLPVGGVGGAVAKGARGLNATSKGGRYLTQTLQRGAGRAGVEGAAIGTVLADPDERGAGAALGAVIGAPLGGLGTVLGKTLGKGKVAEITREAKQLQKMTGQFIPLSQSAEQGITKQVYNALLANIPGVGGKVRGQYKTALDDLRRFAGEHAHPPTANIEIGARDSVETMMGKLDDYWKTAFDDIKSWPITTFKDVTPKPADFLKKMVEKQGQGLVKFPRAGVDTTGADILTLKTTLGELTPKMGARARAEVAKYQKGLDALLDRNFNPSGKGKGVGAQVLHDYREAARYYPSWMALKRATNKAKDNMNFTPGNLAKAANKTNVLAEKSVQQRAGELGIEALEDFPSRQGLFQTLAAMGATAGGVMAAGAPGLLAYPAIVALGRMGASKGLQKYLSGQTKFQRLNKVLMRKYKKELQALGMTARQAAVTLGVDDAT